MTSEHHDASLSAPSQGASLNPAPTSPASPARRRLLTNALGTAVAGALLGTAVACGDDADGEDGAKPGDTPRSGRDASMPSRGTPDRGTPDAGAMEDPDADVEPLLALLTAEYQAVAAYGAGAGLIEAAGDDDALFELKARILEVAGAFQAHHRLHAEALVAAIRELGGEPIDPEEAAAGFSPPAALVDKPTILNVLKFAAGAERAAAVAYNQVLAGLESSQLRYLTTSIEGDETQHFIVLAALVLGLAAPGPNLDASTTSNLVTTAFVSSVGERDGLQRAVPDYFG